MGPAWALHRVAASQLITQCTGRGTQYTVLSVPERPVVATISTQRTIYVMSRTSPRLRSDLRFVADELVAHAVVQSLRRSGRPVTDDARPSAGVVRDHHHLLPSLLSLSLSLSLFGI